MNHPQRTGLSRLADEIVLELAKTVQSAEQLSQRDQLLKDLNDELRRRSVIAPPDRRSSQADSAM